MATTTKTKAAPKAAPKATPKAATWTTDLWTATMLAEYNKILVAHSLKPVPITQNNIDNFERIMTAEGVGEQMGGFLRDNNPLNIGGNVYYAHSLWTFLGNGVYMKHETGWSTPTGQAFLTTFPTPLAGAKGSAQYLWYVHQNYGSAFTKILQTNAPTAMFGGASPWNGEGGSGTPLKASSSVTAPSNLPSSMVTSPTSLASDVQTTTLTATEAKNAEQWLKLLAPQYKAATGTTLQVPTVAQLETRTRAQVITEIQNVFRPIQKGTTNSVPSASLIAATLQLGGASTAGAATPQSLLPTISNPLSGLTSILADLGSATWWKRIGVFAGGAALLIGGGVIFLSTTKPVQGAAKATAGLL